MQCWRTSQLLLSPIACMLRICVAANRHIQNFRNVGRVNSAGCGRRVPQKLNHICKTCSEIKRHTHPAQCPCCINLFNDFVEMRWYFCSYTHFWNNWRWCGGLKPTRLPLSPVGTRAASEHWTVVIMESGIMFILWQADIASFSHRESHLQVCIFWIHTEFRGCKTVRPIFAVLRLSGTNSATVGTPRSF